MIKVAIITPVTKTSAGRHAQAQPTGPQMIAWQGHTTRRIRQAVIRELLIQAIEARHPGFTLL